MLKWPEVNDEIIMLISVHEAIDSLDELNGVTVEIYGVLSLEYEGQCITHIPESEQRDSNEATGDFYRSSIWTNYNFELMGITEEMLDHFNNREVRVTGLIRGPAPGYSGCGHFSLWPAEINVVALEKHEMNV